MTDQPTNDLANNGMVTTCFSFLNLIHFQIDIFSYWNLNLLTVPPKFYICLYFYISYASADIFTALYHNSKILLEVWSKIMQLCHISVRERVQEKQPNF